MPVRTELIIISEFSRKRIVNLTVDGVYIKGDQPIIINRGSIFGGRSSRRLFMMRRSIYLCPQFQGEALLLASLCCTAKRQFRPFVLWRGSPAGERPAINRAPSRPSTGNGLCRNKALVIVRKASASFASIPAKYWGRAGISQACSGCSSHRTMMTFAFDRQ